jgi:CRISPR-associated endonuclease/helicase Cas3
MENALIINLKPHYEMSEESPADLQNIRKTFLSHQLETLEKLEKHDLVFNTFPTGTGKTLASLLYLKENPGINAILIAPVNELVRQHTEDAEEFIKKAGLNHRVISIDANFLDNIKLDIDHRGKKLFKILTNPEILFENGDYERPLLLVINPDIFYYAIFYLYNSTDRKNIAQIFYTKFSYIIIDEFHYYDAKQFANFLFFILLSKEFGYFEHGRKMLLLTATPSQNFENFLDRLKTTGLYIDYIKPSVVSPDNPGSIRTLSPIKLYLIPFTGGGYNFTDFFMKNKSQFKDLINQGKDGAVISNTLYGINLLSQKLRNSGFTDFQRITGPVPAEERKDALKSPLILATPTVDIGFNFKKDEKKRQTIDFLIFEADSLDQFWQRLGRAGRVLGKELQDEVSECFALIPDALYRKLSNRLENNITMGRDKLASIIEENLEGTYMEKRPVSEYISRYSLLESMHPLSEMDKIIPEEQHIFLEKAFETIKNVFSPKSGYSFEYLCKTISEFKNIKILRHKKTVDKYNIRIVRNFFREIEKCDIEKGQEEEAIDLVNSNDEYSSKFKDFIEEKHQVMSELFSFRAGGISLSIPCLDNSKIINNSTDIVHLDLLHLVRNYQLDFLSYEEFKSFCKDKWKEVLSEIKSKSINCIPVIKSVLDKQIKLNFILSTEEFDEDLFTNQLKAIKGLKLQAEYGTHPLRPEIVNIFSNNYVTCFIVSSIENPGIINSCFRNHIYSYDLEAGNKKYKIFTGIDAYYFVSRYGYLFSKTKEEDAIII